MTNEKRDLAKITAEGIEVEGDGVKALQSVIDAVCGLPRKTGAFFDFLARGWFMRRNLDAQIAFFDERPELRDLICNNPVYQTEISNVMEIGAKASRLKAERGESEFAYPSLKMTEALLEGIPIEGHHDLQDLWARLLDRATSKVDQIEDTSFATTLKAFQPVDAISFNNIYLQPVDLWPYSGPFRGAAWKIMIRGPRVLSGKLTRGDVSQLFDPISLERLAGLNCIRIGTLAEIPSTVTLGTLRLDYMEEQLSGVLKDMFQKASERYVFPTDYGWALAGVLSIPPDIAPTRQIDPKSFS